MDNKTTNIRISIESYYFLKNLKKKTGTPIKVLLDQILTGTRKTSKK